MFLPVALALLLGGCAVARLGDLGSEPTPRAPEPASAAGAMAPAPGARPHYKVGNPYQIDGIWYYPRENPDYDETGIASWYGADFHGKPTANGETYDMDALTAAHKTLPMPSTVRVTNLENGRALVLRVNDRGPFVHGRIIDVSRHASKLLGFHTQGTAKVRVAVLQSGGDRFIAAKPETSEEETQLALAAPRDGVTRRRAASPRRRCHRSRPPRPPSSSASRGQRACTCRPGRSRARPTPDVCAASWRRSGPRPSAG